MSRCPGCMLLLLPTTPAGPECRRQPSPLMGQWWVLGPRTQSLYPYPHRHPGSRRRGPEEQEGEGGAPSPTVHSAKQGAVAVAEAEAVEGPLPADHYGWAPGRSPGGALLASWPLTSPSSAAWLLQWETDPRRPSDGLHASIFNAASQLTYQNPLVYPIPASAGGPRGGSARGNLLPRLSSCPLWAMG